MADSTEDEFYSEFVAIELGNQVRGELNKSPIIQMLIRQAAKGADEALRELVRTPPEDAAAIAALQHEIHRYLGMTRWIEETVRKGDDARNALDRADQLSEHDDGA